MSFASDTLFQSFLPGRRSCAVALAALPVVGLLVTRSAYAADAEDPAKSELELSYQPGVPIEVATRAQKAVAVKQYRMGVDLLGAGKADEALELFRMSYEKVASPNSRLMMARALIRLERYVHAHRELRAVVEEAERLALGAEKYGNTAQAARKELEAVEQHVAVIRIQRDGVLEVNGTPAAQGPRAPLVVMPGRYELSLRLKNGQRAVQAIEAQAGQQYEVQLEVPAPEIPQAATSPEPITAPAVTRTNDVSRKTLGIASASVAVLGTAGFVTFGLLDRSQYQQLERDCVAQRCPASSRDALERGRTYQTIANVGLGVGAVGLVGAAYFFLTARGEDEHDREGTQVRIGPSQVQVFGRF